MRNIRAGMVGLLLAGAVPASAEIIPLVDAAKMFGARESRWLPELSPSGKAVLFFAPGEGAETQLRVFNAETKETRTIFASDGKPESFEWCDWASDTRIICSYGGYTTYESDVVGFSRLVAMRPDGKDLKPLGVKDSAFDQSIRQFDGTVLDWLPEERNAVLMARTYVPQAGFGGMTRRGIGVDRIDLETMKTTTIENPKEDVGSYLTDGRGQVRIMTLEQSDSIGQLTGVTKFRYRSAGAREWKELGAYDSRTGSGIWPVAVDQRSNSAFVLESLGGKDALYRLSLDGSGTKTLIAHNEKVDIDGVIRLDRGQPVIGYRYTDDRQHIVYFDPEYQKLAASLSKALPETPLITFASASADGKLLVIHASSDTDPGVYYLLDRTTREMQPILISRLELEDHHLAPVKAITYPAADGTKIPAYLTVATELVGKKIPAVVLPHGGPSARDEWGFDWLAQFLAARGYAVIQPNYRGSAGYGDDFLGENAFRDWRTAMEDISAASKYLVDAGISDANHIAIVGWSYGGYAALQLATLEPDRYKAVVAIAPVTDLGALKRDSRGFTNSSLTQKFVGSGEHIKAGSPLRNAERIKVPVLLAHGDLDGNVRVDHSVKMAAALKRAGTPVEFLRYKDLEHQLDDSTARIELLTKIGELLDRTIGH